MGRAITFATCTLGLIFTSACTSFYGPVRPIQAGKLGGAQRCASQPAQSSPILEVQFKDAACASLDQPLESVPAEAMYEAGFLLVTARCNDFFAQKAGTQLGVNTAFDSIAPIVALLTGILSITELSSERRSDYESALAFGSVALASGLKAYETNFLFSTDNIEAVRKLTMDTVNEHANAVRKLNPKSHRFHTSARYVVENQMICTPGSIRDLVKKAVQTQKFTYTARDVKVISGQSGATVTVADPAGQDAGATLDQTPG